MRLSLGERAATNYWLQVEWEETAVMTLTRSSPFIIIISAESVFIQPNVTVATGFMDFSLWRRTVISSACATSASLFGLVAVRSPTPEL